MMETIKKLALLIALSLIISGCNKEELPDGKTPQGAPLTISVSDAGYTSNNPLTRATENDYTTAFTVGDQIGVYLVNSSDMIVVLSTPFTYDGMNWTGTTLYSEGTGARYFAYYPYDKNLVVNPVRTATDAAGFFANVISAWTPDADQSTYAAYTGSDLMIGSGTLSGKQLSFTMTHAMALVAIETPTTKYTFTNNIPGYYLPAPDAEFAGFTPYCPTTGVYRYLVKPAQSGADNLVGSYTGGNGNTREYTLTQNNIAAGNYAHYKVDGATVATKSHTLQVGDFYLKDGHLVGKDETLTAAQQAACIGIVFQTVQSRIGDAEKIALGGHAHGLVMALKDASSIMSWGLKGVDLSLTNCVTKAQCYGDISGYGNCSVVKTANPDLGNYYAFGAANGYNTTCPAPGSSTGWFLPSVGQWWDILQHLGGSAALASPGEQTSSDSGDFRWDSQGDLSAKLNAWMSQIPDIQKDVFNGGWFFSSSEYDGNNTRLVNFGSNLRVFMGDKYGYRKVRPVLAF